MSAVWDGGSSVAGGPVFLDKERIVAGPGFNRWLVPPAALAIHLCTYGGGFATVPAYLADLFGAIHGRLLTAWTSAGILGLGKFFN